MVASNAPNFQFNCETKNITENSFLISCVYDNTIHLQSAKQITSNQTNDDSNNQFKSNPLSFKKALYIFPITFYVCEIYFQDQLISTQNLTIHNPYTNSYLGK